jgi:peptide/nickel transport system substrate-binding protein/oligopeptide transport system substrate-binding protein
VRVRQAFSLALERTALLPAASRPVQPPSVHLVPEGMPGYNPDLADAAGRTGTDALRPDLDAARTLANAYATEQCAGDFAKRPAVTVNDSSSSQPELAQGSAAQWRQAFPGWVIHLMGTSHGGRFEDLLESRAELGWLGRRLSRSTGFPQRPVGDPCLLQLCLLQPCNQSHVSVAPVDALLAHADGMSDLTTRLPLYHHAEQLLLTQGAATPLAQPYATYALRSRVAHWRIAPTNRTPLSLWQTAYLTR